MSNVYPSDLWITLQAKCLHIKGMSAITDLENIFK